MSLSRKYYEELFFNSGDDRDLLPQNQDAIIELLDINGAVGVFGLYDEEGYPVYFISGFALTAMGYSFDEMIRACGGRFINLVYEKDREGFIEHSKSEDLKCFEFRMVHASGRNVWVNFYRKKSVSAEGKTIVVASIRVVDDAKKRESELLEALTKGYSRIIYVDVNQGRFRAIKNEGTAFDGQFFGTLEELQALMERYGKEYIYPEDYTFAEVLKELNFFAKPDEKGGSYQATFRSKVNGEYQWVQFQAFYGGAMNLDTGHFILTFRVVDEEKKKELETNKILSDSLAKEEAARHAKNNFLSRMSHDMRTPINGIVGMLEIAKSNRGNQEKIDECLEKISISCENLISLVQDVLDMNNLENGDMELSDESIDLYELLEKELGSFEKRAVRSGFTYKSDLEGIAGGRIMGSPKHILQIFEHILDNAIKYNKPNGKIYFSGRELSKNDHTVMYEFTVSDSGVGMSREFIDRIFEPFEQEHGEVRTRYIGTGLGMSIVKLLVDQMEGSIEVDSEIGKGTRVTLKLPFKLSSSEEDAGKKQEEIDFSKVNVLLVEDNEMNMEIAQFVLESAGMKVTCAVNGREAVDIFTNSEKGAFDVILMDIMMPVMDGLEAAREIRKMNREDAVSVSIIALSANVMDSDIKMSKMAGMDEHLPKPIDSGQLFFTIQKCLQKA